MTELQVRKRDGRLVTFDVSKIEQAVLKAALDQDAQRPGNADYARGVAQNVATRVEDGFTVEQIQNLVEEEIMRDGEYDLARSYILYREEHRKQREDRPIPDSVREAFAADRPYFPTALQQFQFYDKYSRFNYELGRRETWVETVDRSVAYLHELAAPYGDLGADTFERIRRGILTMQVMPSMRLLAMAGAPARRNNIAIYNCSYQPVDSLDAFTEALIISMSGCGVGYSVEEKYVQKLPYIQPQRGHLFDVWKVEDSAEGWAAALTHGLWTWVNGGDVTFDTSEIRPAGAPLRVKGGRASGPEPLEKMLAFMRGRILARQGRRMRPIDAHDMMCAVGSAAVSGGVRRTAMIALYDYDDELMLRCKEGDFERENSQRWNANNSAVWPAGGPSAVEFMTQFTRMVAGGRGEPGIFSRDVARNLAPDRRETHHEFGTNPCGEIVLRPFQFCNLSAAVARADDTEDTLREKVELATLIGTIQSLATYFPGLRHQWTANCEEERLLGVDITGQMDSAAAQDAAIKGRLRLHAIQVNEEAAHTLGINSSASITCVKPSGNTSQLVDCSSGLHARWAPYYLKNARVSAHTPIFQVLRDAGVPMDPENGQTPENATTWVIHFPVKVPDGAVTRNDRTAIEQCEFWLQNKVHWTEHNPSVTITYKPDEAVGLLNWVWEHRDKIGGMAFLPSFDAQYAQLPLVEITQEEYERRVAEFPTIDFSKVYRYELSDLTTAAQELACSAGYCEIDT